MALQGTLESFDISEIFQLISQQGKTGTLEIVTDGVLSRIRFLQGRVVEAWADKRAPSEMIGSMLVRAGLINANQLDHALGVQKQSLRPLGDILIRMGAVRIAEFQEMLVLQHRETVYRHLGRKRGSFSFRDELVVLEEGVSVPLDTGSLLMEGFRQIDEWPRLLAALPAEGKILAPTADGGEVSNAEELRVFDLVDGVATVREIADRSRLGDFPAWRALVSLLEKGAITSVDSGRRPAVLRRRESLISPRVFDAGIAFALLVLSLAVLLAGTASSTPHRLGGAWAEARAEARELSRRAAAWEARRLPTLPGGAVFR